MTMRMILKNLEIAKTHLLPMCQDTGMVVAFIDVGPDVPFSMAALQAALEKGIVQAQQEGLFRHSVIEDPVFTRKNRETNLPAVIHWSTSDKPGVSIHMLLKGFGSENCSSLVMLNPTSGEKEVSEAVLEAVKRAGGKPCPPIVVGVGLGGTAERALELSKRALLRPTGTPHPVERYAHLEQLIEQKIQQTEIGPGGFGGPLTALAVAVEHEPTHIAGLPVGISISCWAERKATVWWGGSDD